MQVFVSNNTNFLYLYTVPLIFKPVFNKYKRYSTLTVIIDTPSYSRIFIRFFDFSNQVFDLIGAESGDIIKLANESSGSLSEVFATRVLFTRGRIPGL